MNPLVLTYLAYVLISVGLTVWVARTLRRGGRIFLVDVFAGNSELADSVNHLLEVGFYLLNLGFVSLFLKIGYSVDGAAEAIEALSTKVGAVLLVLGVVHFGNLYVFSRIRRRTLVRRAGPPVAPSAYLPQDPSGPADGGEPQPQGV